MHENIGADATREVKKTREGGKMVEHAKDQRAQDKEGIREFFRTNDKVLQTSELLKAGMTEKNFVLTKEVYAEMAREALGESDEEAKSLLNKRLEGTINDRDIGRAWNSMMLYTPTKLAEFILKESAEKRQVKKEEDEKVKTSVLQATRSRIKERPTMLVEEAEMFTDFTNASRRSEGAKGNVTSEGWGWAPEDVKSAVGKAEGKVRRGKGFKAATGEFEPKAEAFAAGVSLKELKAQEKSRELLAKAQEEVRKTMSGLTRLEIAQFQPHADRYLRNVAPRSKEWDDKIEEAKKAGNLDRANELQASADKEAELNRTLLEELAKAIKVNPQILE